jgi:hypothetical protein
MDNQTDVSVNESKPKSHGCLIAFLITFAVIILHIVAIPVLIEIVDHIPRTKDTQTNGQYVVELQATSSPDWPFGSQDGRIVLKDNNNKKICSVDFSLSNDGKSMCESNWKVDWSEESVIVTIMGEEQKDAVYTLYYNGDVSN